MRLHYYKDVTESRKYAKVIFARQEIDRRPDTDVNSQDEDADGEHVICDDQPSQNFPRQRAEPISGCRARRIREACERRDCATESIPARNPFERGLAAMLMGDRYEAAEPPPPPRSRCYYA